MVDLPKWKICIQSPCRLLKLSGSVPPTMALCFDENDLPTELIRGDDFRQFNENRPPLLTVDYAINLSFIIVVCNKFMFYHCGMKSYNDIHYNRDTTQLVKFHFIE